VVPLVATAAGLALGGEETGEGDVVDWLVVMRRVPASRMLPEMLARGQATPAHADELGDVLARFYRAATPARWSGASYRRHLRHWITGIGRELVDRGAPRARMMRIVNAQLAAVTHLATVLDARVTIGRVVDAHGDLRPEHVCLESPPVVIDPLEFSDELRLLDAASELAFFALECERLGAAWFADRVVTRYCTATGDRIPAAVSGLYRSQHALTRALIALRHLDDRPVADHPRWRARAADYYALAEIAPPAVSVRAPA
jgi:aminoglycoside phosphotransferase family enzyme